MKTRIVWRFLYVHTHFYVLAILYDRQWGLRTNALVIPSNIQVLCYVFYYILLNWGYLTRLPRRVFLRKPRSLHDILLVVALKKCISSVPSRAKLPWRFNHRINRTDTHMIRHYSILYDAVYLDRRTGIEKLIHNVTYVMYIHTICIHTSIRFTLLSYCIYSNIWSHRTVKSHGSPIFLSQ